MTKKKLNLLVMTIMCCSWLLSCTQRAPHEITSPCVSVDDNSSGLWAINPCIRKPLNRAVA